MALAEIQVEDTDPEIRFPADEVRGVAVVGVADAREGKGRVVRADPQDDNPPRVIVRVAGSLDYRHACDIALDDLEAIGERPRRRKEARGSSQTSVLHDSDAEGGIAAVVLQLEVEILEPSRLNGPLPGYVEPHGRQGASHRTDDSRQDVDGVVQPAHARTLPVDPRTAHGGARQGPERAGDSRRAVRGVGGRMTDFSGVEAKFSRAVQHYETLDRQIADFENLYPYSIRVEPTLDRTQAIAYVGGLQDPRSEWSLLTGDCLFNLRSALDHLICAVWTGDCDKDRPEFPIYNKVRKDSAVTEYGITVPRAAQNKVRKVPAHERAVIYRLQPCNRANDPDPDIGPTRDNLWLLHDLNIIDKHRRLNPVRSAWGATTMQGWGGSGTVNYRWVPERGPLKNNAPVGRFVFDTPQLDMHVDAQVALPVAIEYAGAFAEVTQLQVTLWSCIKAVSITLKRVSEVTTTVPGVPYPRYFAAATYP